jgi:tetratricopeptide (TPR) repeat protein
LEISPKDEAAAYNVGEVFFSNQQIDEAIKYFELAVQIKKDWSKPYLKLGYVYLNKGDFAKSLEYFNSFIQMDPDNPEVSQVKNVIAAIEKMKK